ncbi:hypothetical protein ACFTWF_22595 [Rhodococcus sp. NPDC056960]|uniref:hypothetical protein n=1 Tax=Rhodococcus sp. NPDC056960 TaxID=3345982 RepID=UPI0036386E78
MARRVRSVASIADGAAGGGIADRGVSLPAASHAHDQVSAGVAAVPDPRRPVPVRQCPHVGAAGAPHAVNGWISAGEGVEEPEQSGRALGAAGGERVRMRTQMVQHRPRLRGGQVQHRALVGERLEVGVGQPRSKDCGEVGDRRLPLLGVGAGSHSPWGRRMVVRRMGGDGAAA